MTALVGNISLGLAFVAAALAVIAALAASKFQAPGLLRLTRGMVAAIAGLFTVASAALAAAFVSDDFTLRYVAGYSETALPLGYKLAAFWAGQAGSLLLWGWLLAVMSLVAVLFRRGRDVPITEQAGTAATLAIACGFFAALMLFATDEQGVAVGNPFDVFPAAAMVPQDGNGLNPMLQDPGMIAHPPLLFLGYAGYTIPFAMLIGAMIAGRRDSGWIGGIRRWSIASWLFLTVGILLGCQWAYVELGWGGYWAWDPVENASLLPWLTGTALLHSIMVQQQRGMFKVWNVGLVAGTFVLCLFGTYLTRSGVIQSVHGFPKSGIGLFFLACIGVSILATVVLMVWRRGLLKAERQLEGLVGREGAFLATNILLVGIMLVTLIGTISPILFRAFGSERAATPEFYNNYVAPMGLVLVALMAAGPLLTYGSDAAVRFAKRLIVPAVLALIAAGWIWAMGVANPWALLAAVVIALTGAAIAVDLVRSVITRVRTHGENPVVALVKLLDGNHRRYGGQVVHIGVAMMIAGIVGSSLFGHEKDFQLAPGQRVEFHGNTIEMGRLAEVDNGHFTAVQAPVKVFGPDGRGTLLTPQVRYYDKSKQPNTEVAIRSTLREDFYVSLAGWDNGGRTVTLEVLLNPLVSWIWVGGIVMTLGGVVCLVPRFIPAAAPVPAAAVPTEPATPEPKPQQKKGKGNKGKRPPVPATPATA